MKKVFSHIWKNRKTTALGLAGLAGVALKVYTNPVGAATDPETLLQTISSIGLIVAADPKKAEAK